MKIDENTYNLFDSYLKGTLNKKDAIDFESKLKSNLELNEEFLIQKSFFETINKQDWSQQTQPNPEDVKILGDYFNSESAKKTKDAINHAKKNYNTKKSKIINFKYLYASAAAILILFGYFNFFANSSSENLYNEYKNWDSLPSLTERFDDTNDLSKAERFFENKNYLEAIAIFKLSINNSNKNPQVLAYLGASYLELENYEFALKTFDDLLKTNSLDKTKAYWYKTLIFIKLDQKENAIKMLDIILSNEANYNFNKAKELKVKLLKL